VVNLDVVHTQMLIVVPTKPTAVQVATNVIFPRANVLKQLSIHLPATVFTCPSVRLSESKLQHQWLVLQELVLLLRLVAILGVVNLDVVHTQMLIVVLTKLIVAQMATNVIFPRANVLKLLTVPWSKPFVLLVLKESK